MKSKMMNVIGGTAAALMLTFFTPFTTVAGEVPVTVGETQVVSTTQPEDLSENTPNEETNALETTIQETITPEESNPETATPGTDVTAETDVILDETVAEETSVDTKESDWTNKVMANVEENVNVREGASTDTARIGVLFKGGSGEILERGDEWTKVKSGDLEGYIFNKYLAFDNEAYQLSQQFTSQIAIVTATGLNVRQEPTTESAILTVVKKGQALLVAENVEGIQNVEGWVPVNVSDGTVAYVSGDYVIVEERSSAAVAVDNIANAQPVVNVVQVSNKAAAATTTEATNTTDTTAAPAVAETVVAEAATPEPAAAAEVVYETTPVAASQSDLDMLAAIIECEAGGESYEGMIGVGAVVMNRVNSPSFPNSISEVIYQSGQFTPVSTGWFQEVLARGARPDCYAAAQDVLNGANTIGDCLFFHAGAGNGYTIGNQTFY